MHGTTFIPSVRRFHWICFCLAILEGAAINSQAYWHYFHIDGGVNAQSCATYSKESTNGWVYMGTQTLDVDGHAYVGFQQFGNGFSSQYRVITLGQTYDGPVQNSSGADVTTRINVGAANPATNQYRTTLCVTNNSLNSMFWYATVAEGAYIPPNNTGFLNPGRYSCMDLLTTNKNSILVYTIKTRLIESNGVILGSITWTNEIGGNINWSWSTNSAIPGASSGNGITSGSGPKVDPNEDNKPIQFSTNAPPGSSDRTSQEGFQAVVKTLQEGFDETINKLSWVNQNLMMMASNDWARWYIDNTNAALRWSQQTNRWGTEDSYWTNLLAQQGQAGTNQQTGQGLTNQANDAQIFGTSLAGQANSAWLHAASNQVSLNSAQAPSAGNENALHFSLLASGNPDESLAMIDLRPSSWSPAMNALMTAMHAVLTILFLVWLYIAIWRDFWSTWDDMNLHGTMVVKDSLQDGLTDAVVKIGAREMLASMITVALAGLPTAIIAMTSELGLVDPFQSSPVKVAVDTAGGVSGSVGAAAAAWYDYVSQGLPYTVMMSSVCNYFLYKHFKTSMSLVWYAVWRCLPVFLIAALSWQAEAATVLVGNRTREPLGIVVSDGTNWFAPGVWELDLPATVNVLRSDTNCIPLQVSFGSGELQQLEAYEASGQAGLVVHVIDRKGPAWAVGMGLSLVFGMSVVFIVIGYIRGLFRATVGNGGGD